MNGCIVRFEVLILTAWPFLCLS